MLGSSAEPVRTPLHLLMACWVVCVQLVVTAQLVLHLRRHVTLATMSHLKAPSPSLTVYRVNPVNSALVAQVQQLRTTAFLDIIALVEHQQVASTKPRLVPIR